MNDESDLKLSSSSAKLTEMAGFFNYDFLVFK